MGSKSYVCRERQRRVRLGGAERVVNHRVLPQAPFARASLPLPLPPSPAAPASASGPSRRGPRAGARCRSWTAARAPCCTPGRPAGTRDQGSGHGRTGTGRERQAALKGGLSSSFRRPGAAQRGAHPAAGRRHDGPGKDAWLKVAHGQPRGLHLALEVDLRLRVGPQPHLALLPARAHNQRRQPRRSTVRSTRSLWARRSWQEASRREHWRKGSG